MAKHTEAEMEQLSPDDLKRLAEEEATQPPKPVVQAEPATEEDEPETFVARREVDLQDGSGVQVYEATGDSREAALEALADKIADAQVHATKKIRQQEAELKDFRARSAEPPKPKEISEDEEYTYSQELQKKPLATLRKMWKELTGYEVEDFVTAKQAADAVVTAQRSNEAVNTFIATHPDYEDRGDAGNKNAALVRMKLAELRLPVTSENLSKAYSQLKQSGLLLLKSEEANADATTETKEPQRIVEPKVEPAQTRTKKTSTISTHSRVTSVPANVGPSEDEAEKMTPDQLRALANKQLAGQIERPAWAR
jgi:hypothetical protein